MSLKFADINITTRKYEKFYNKFSWCTKKQNQQYFISEFCKFFLGKSNADKVFPENGNLIKLENSLRYMQNISASISPGFAAHWIDCLLAANLHLRYICMNCNIGSLPHPAFIVSLFSFHQVTGCANLEYQVCSSILEGVLWCLAFSFSITWSVTWTLKIARLCSLCSPYFL